MKNKIIVTAALKGGVGKSTLCSLLASYLVKNGIPVAVLDADIQQSIMQHRQLDLKEHPDAIVPWQVNSLIAATEKDMMAVMEKIKAKLSEDGTEACILIDCPGNVQDQALKFVYHAADIIIVPFHYDCDSIHATEQFLDMLRKVTDARILLQPNRVVKFEDETQYDAKWSLKAKELVRDKKKADDILARIKDGKAVPKYSTLEITIHQERAVEHAFETIFNELIDKNENGE